jgi:DNA mismatch repair protein MutL
VTIRILPPALARQIAAGEVVSRPLDVLRELVDNALDAGASRIEIELDGGGLKRLLVRDNGAGIPAAEVELAPLRHATSKLETVERVTTLGFRGEALWAMAQAGHLSLLTRPPEQLGGAHLEAAGDHVSVSRRSAPAGTTAEVTGLFAALPARLRTQQTPAAEVREAVTLLGRYLLHRPELHWRLSVDGEPRLTHAPGDARAAVASVYGALSANRMLPLEYRSASRQISGVLSRPELTRARRDRLHFSVNGRPVLAPPELERAVVAGYGELLPAGQSPVGVLNLTLPPEDVNPNVHPAKATVALADLPELARVVTAAVTAALSALPLARPAPALRQEGEAALSPTRHGTFPHLTALAVHSALYLLAQGEGPDAGDLWIVDVHAAHERALYESLLGSLDAAESVALPSPELLNLTPAQLARLEERGPELRGWGLGLEVFGPGLARLSRLPASVAALPVAGLHERLTEWALGDSPDPRREVMARLACLPALKAGHVTLELGREVLRGLSSCEQPWACPHGRPTVLRLSERDLAHSFGRRGPRDVARGRDVGSVRVEVEER